MQRVIHSPSNFSDFSTAGFIFAVCNNRNLALFFSSPEPKAHGWANSIQVTQASVRRPSVHNFKHLLWNHRANQTQISYGDILRTREWKFVQMVLVTWPRWPPHPYMVKTFKNLRLQNQKADDLETWYVAFGMWDPTSLFKWCPRLTLTYLTSRSNLLSNAFKWEIFLKTVEAQVIILTWYVYPNETMAISKFQRSMLIFDLSAKLLILESHQYIKT